MKRLLLIVKIRYWDRISRYLRWKKLFLSSGWDKKFSHQQAWRQSAWYDPVTGRSVHLIENLYAPKPLRVLKQRKKT